jgi:hypothetical protein
MKCYTHSEVDAVGFCRVCGRALCRDCVAEVSGICCCKGRCEASVKTWKQYQAELVQYRAGFRTFVEGFARSVGNLIVTAVAILLLLVGGIAKSSHEEANATGNLLILVGVVLLARGLYLFYKARRAKKHTTPPVLPHD